MKKTMCRKQLSTNTSSTCIAVLYFLLVPFTGTSQTADNYFKQALLNDSLQKFSSALQACNRAIAVNPGFAKAYYLRGKACFHLKDYKGAIKDVNKAAQLHLQNENIYLVRAYARLALHEYAIAIQDFNKAIVFNPGNSLTWYHRGYTNLQLHNKKKARTDFSKAIELGIKESGDIVNGFEPE